MKTDICHKHSLHERIHAHTTKSSGFFSLLSTLLIILIPKCPLCFAAYMSSFLLFREVDLSAINPLFVHLKMILVAIIFFSILLVYKGKRTILSLGIVILCGIFISLANYARLSILPNEVIYSSLFFTSWYNGNFASFYKYVKKHLYFWAPKK